MPYSGDLLFAGGTPFLLMGAIAGAGGCSRTCSARSAPQTIVPGHGPVAGPGLVEEVLGCLRFVPDVAAGGRAAGPTALEAARETDLGAYAGWHDPERIVGNLHRAYA